MKRTMSYMAGLVALMYLVGCATFESTSYKTIGTVTTTVEAARQAWVSYVTEQRVLIPDASKRQDLEVKVAKVGDAYAKYQASMRVAKAAILAYKAQPTDQSTVNTALNVVAASAGDLVALINSFITK